jgi:hypothetical protein
MLETNTKPFKQFNEPHPKRHFHWALFIIIAIAIASAVLIYIQNFKTAEEIDSMAPNVKNISEQQKKK